VQHRQNQESREDPHFGILHVLRATVYGVSLLSRYNNGERVEVWEHLATLSIDDLSAEQEADVRAVAAETMKRARHNVELIYDRLCTMGFEFLTPKVADVQKVSTQFGEITYPYQAFTPADAQDFAHYLPRVTETCGQLPLSLEAWYEHVGAINLMGDYPGLCGYRYEVLNEQKDQVLPDPLCVYPLAYALSEYDSYLISHDEEPTNDFVFPLTPDIGYKHYVEGDGYEGIVVPAETVDAEFTLTNEPFVRYFRRSFQWGGFPGWRRHETRPAAILQHLSAGLLPI
jgi:hypothetical protein